MTPPIVPLPEAPVKTGANRWLPLWLSLGFVGLVLGLRFTALREIPLPPCLLRKFTGIPCPSCGCTRSLLAWSHFNFAQAFFFNPLFFVCCVAGLLWAALWWTDPARARSWLERWRLRTTRWPVGGAFLVLVGLNWLYLCLWLPK